MDKNQKGALIGCLKLKSGFTIALHKAHCLDFPISPFFSVNTKCTLSCISARKLSECGHPGCLATVAERVTQEQCAVPVLPVATN